MATFGIHQQLIFLYILIFRLRKCSVLFYGFKGGFRNNGTVPGLSYIVNLRTHLAERCCLQEVNDCKLFVLDHELNLFYFPKSIKL